MSCYIQYRYLAIFIIIALLCPLPCITISIMDASLYQFDKCSPEHTYDIAFTFSSNYYYFQSSNNPGKMLG